MGDGKSNVFLFLATPQITSIFTSGDIMINKMIAGMLPYMPQKLVWLFSKEYVAGQTLEEAIVNAKKLNAEGILTTIDVLI